MTGTAATPGQAAYEAYRADLASRLAWSADEIYAFSSLSDEEREGWEGIAQAAIAAQEPQPAPELAAALRKIRSALEDGPAASTARREALEIINSLGLGQVREEQP